MDAPFEDPLFSYTDEDPYLISSLCEISPTKPDDHIHYSQVSSSISSWSPTSVFTSPHVSSHNELRSLQSHTSFLDAPEPNVSSSECGLQISSSEVSASYTRYAHYDDSTHPSKPQENTDRWNALVEHVSKICKPEVPQASTHDRGSQGSDAVQGSFAQASDLEVPRCDCESLNNPNEIGTLHGLINKSLDPTTRPGDFMPQLPQNIFGNLHHTSKPGAATENEQMQNITFNFAVMASNPNERMYNHVIGMPRKYPADVSNDAFGTLQYSEWNVPSDKKWLIPNYKFLIPATGNTFSHTSIMPRTDSRMIMSKGCPSTRQTNQTNSAPSLQLSEGQRGHQISSMYKSEPAVEGEGCKHCKCKSSACLKLYCPCFASQAFCTGPCSCKNCFNKPNHKHKVLEARRAIESRRPSAFAPKVIRSADSLLGNGVNPKNTSALTRHRRGCSCKKSGCQKQYCECHKNGVGCSIRCRCEGCKNTYGRNYDFPELEIETEAQGNGSYEMLAVEKVPHVTEALNNELGHPIYAATSPTPSRPTCSAPLRDESRRKRPRNSTIPTASRFHARPRLCERNVRHDQSEFEYNSQSNTQMGMPNIHQVDDGTSTTGMNNCFFGVKEIFYHPS